MKATITTYTCDRCKDECSPARHEGYSSRYDHAITYAAQSGEAMITAVSKIELQDSYGCTVDICRACWDDAVKEVFRIHAKLEAKKPPGILDKQNPNQWITDAQENPWPLDFNDYQKAAATTADYARMGRNPNYPALGLAGEAGEVCEHIKKVERDDAGIVTPKRLEALKKEIGDVLWYIATLCTELDLSLADVAQGNLDKLADRKARGVIHGSGDER